MAQIGVINEIGDMGLGFNSLNETDQMKYDQSLEKNIKNEIKKEEEAGKSYDNDKK